jgi:NAD-dependent DNA ligase
MGKTFRNMRDESRTRGKNKMVNREEKAIEKYKKHIYNKASTVIEDADYDDDDDNLDYESNYIQPIQRK